MEHSAQQSGEPAPHTLCGFNFALIAELVQLDQQQWQQQVMEHSAQQSGEPAQHTL
jgi:hypothetical protein